jgi:hypothetical protein
MVGSNALQTGNGTAKVYRSTPLLVQAVQQTALPEQKLPRLA